MGTDIYGRLSQSDKGQLKYGNTRSPTKKIYNNDSAQHPFNLTKLRICLEAVEDEAHIDELKYMESKYDYQTKSFNKKSSKNHVPNVIGDNADVILAQHIAESEALKQTEIQNKLREYQAEEKKAFLNAQQKLQKLKQKDESREQKRQHDLMMFQKSSEHSANTIKQQNIEQQQSSSRKLRTKLQEAEKRKQIKQQQGKERLDNSETIFNQCSECYARTKLILQKESYKEFVHDAKIVTLQESFEKIFHKIQELSEHCHKQGIMEHEEWTFLSDVLAKFLFISQTIIATIEELKRHNILVEEDKRKQLQLQQEKEEKKKQIMKIEKQKLLKQNNPELSCPSLPKDWQLSVSRSAYFRFQELKKLVNQYEEIMKKLNSDKQHQKLIIGLTKAISVPISSITNRSGSDIKSKLSDLNGLLKGQDVNFGNQRVNISNHPNASNYACFFMAKKFVKQAEGQVSSNHAAAFSLALTVLGVWEQNKVVGELVLGQLQMKCPFIIPCYVPKLENQSELEYNRLRGYICGEDGSVEPQDKYLKRMSGFVRTYAALIQSPLPPNVRKHPHGIEEGWKWITRMLNLEPWPEITATVLFDFLEIAGHALMETYNLQFKKLLYSLCHDYFPKIKEVSGNKGGPLQRLEMFLLECIKTNQVPKPDGYLGPDFWNTYHHTAVVGS
uniref:mRNA export factor GLE1 n=1 Tax=Phallusia mammillata TaxID=59560 RepID=A0A6F9DCY1_9ASCI|nr:nucleoporin GLE1 [Phallusia mammillata]